MRIEEQPAWDRPVSAGEAEENAGPVYVSVQDAGWDQYAPQLPEDVVGMVATPIVVGSTPIVPAVEPMLRFASAEIDPTLVPAFLAPAAVSPAPAGVPAGAASGTAAAAGTASGAAGTGAAPAAVGSVTAGGPVGRRRRRRSRIDDRKPRR